MDISFEGVGQVAATFKVDGEVLPGMAVTLTDDGTVGLGAAGDTPCGVVLGGVRGGAAAVQIGGVAKVRCSGTAPKAGWQELVCDGEGGVKAVSGGGSGIKVVTGDKTSIKDVVEPDVESDIKSVAGAVAGGLKCLVLAVDEDEDGKSVVIKL